MSRRQERKEDTSALAKRIEEVRSRPAEVIHRKKLFGGTMTAEEVHSKYAFPPNAQCTGCKTRSVITRIIVLMELQEARKRDPLMDSVMAVNPMLFNQLLVPTKYGVFLRVSTVYACKRCTPDAEKVAAKAPSWCIVDINRGPTPDVIISSARVR